MLNLPLHRQTRFVLVSPHYPENVGAAARALKTMGFTRLGLVRPGKLAYPEHLMARKMAVKSLDVLEQCETFDNLDEALVGHALVVATTSRRGVSGVLSPRQLAERVLDVTERGQLVGIVFGNEKTGLTSAEMGRADVALRIPMAAAQPSVNLAQAVQVVAYELFSSALGRRGDAR